MFYVVSRLLSDEVHVHGAYFRKVEEAAVEEADDTEQENAGDCDPEAEALAACATEIGNDAFIFADEHCLHYEKIVV